MNIKKHLFRLWKRDSLRKVSRIERYLEKDQGILDLGCGPCHVASILENKGYSVTPMDIRDNSVVSGIDPVIYDGSHIPFDNDEFDITLILTVLHHVKDPISLLEEVKRVSKGAIIIEDIFSNPFEKVLIMALDSLINLEFRGHPHNNLEDVEWRDLFDMIGFEIVDIKYHRIAKLFTQSTYFIVRR